MTKTSFPPKLRQSQILRTEVAERMSERKPTWLSLKRLDRFNPLVAVRPMLTPMAPGEQAGGRPPEPAP